MSIAILGWGSLLWDVGPAFDAQHDSWREGGPLLPIEFTRISRKRLDALTLVIDHVHGTPTSVNWCLSRRASVSDGVRDLADREGTSEANIGCLGVTTTSEREQATDVDDVIRAWGIATSVEWVLWTNLRSNFAKKTGRQFSLERALDHLKSLSSGGLVQAREYFLRAPDFVRTRLRTRLGEEAWFFEQRQAESIE